MRSKKNHFCFIRWHRIWYSPIKTPILESHPTDPVCSYGISKLAIEKYLALSYINGGPDYTILRLANPYGRYQPAEASQGVIAVFMKKALNNEIVEIWGDGSVVRDYIYVADAVKAMLKSLAYSGKVKLFNVGSGKGFSVNQILDAIETTIGNKLERKYTRARKFDVPENILDISCIKEQLEWKPLIGLEEGLKQVAEYIQNN